MSDNWEVKAITKSGSGFNIRIGPKNETAGVGLAIVAIVLTLFTMSVLDVAGWIWGIALFLIYAVLTSIFPIIAGISFVSIICWFFLKPESDPQSVKDKQNTEIQRSQNTERPKTTDLKYEARSDSKEFSGAKLGGKIKDHMFGDRMDMDGGPYFFSKNNALLSYSLDDGIDSWAHGVEGKITTITFYCSTTVFRQGLGHASIDNISCDSSIADIEKSQWSKQCNTYHFGSYKDALDVVYLKGNAFVSVSQKRGTPKITGLGLYENVAFTTGFEDCQHAEILKNKAMKQGYKSLGDMMVENRP